MHTGHIVLVKAEDHEDAISRVWTAVNAYDDTWFASNWSDWAVVADQGVSGSRWNIHHFLEDEEIQTEHEYALSFATERELFDTVVNRQLEQRAAEFDNLTRELREAGADSIYNFRLDQDDEVSWNLRNLTNLVTGVYNPNSKIFDLENYDANLQYFKKDIEDGNTDWFAVVVDFHF